MTHYIIWEKINLKRFVDINIQPKPENAIVGIRDTVVLFTPDGTLGTVAEYSSMNEVEYASTTDTYAYLKVFFDNGGVKARA